MSESSRIAKRVLLIGWDAADWQLIDKYMAEGSMPHMKKFLERGSRGNLATLKPILSPMLWNSIGTGKRPYKHGIHGFTEPMPDGKGVRPSSSTTRKCKAIWNILTQEGMTSNVVSWFVGHPAEPIKGICVSDLFGKVAIDKKDPQSTVLPKLPDGCIHPESLREKMSDLRLHAGELTEEEILLFIPKAYKIDQDKDRRLTAFARLFAEMISVHNAATFVMEQNDWDFMGVYYDSIDHFGHAFMEYHPPQMAHIKDEDFEIYQELIASCYKFHDLILGRLMYLAGNDTTIILCSDHGYRNDHLRPVETPKEPAGPAAWHRDQGIVAMSGPGIKQGAEIYGASLIDITPTILNLLGLPVAEDMDGKPLLHAFDADWWESPTPIPSWEDVEGEAGMHSKEQQEDPFAAREALRQLVELGYIEEPDKNQEKAAENAAREAKYNLARAYQDGGLLDEAAIRMEELYEENPEKRLGIALARIYMKQRRFDEVRPLAEGLLAALEKANIERAERMEKAAQHLEEKPDEIFAESKKKRETTYEKRVEAEKIKAQEEKREPVTIKLPKDPDSDEFMEHLNKRKRMLLETSAELRDHDVRSVPTVHLLLGRLAVIDKDFKKALDHLSKAELKEPRLPGLHLQKGQTYLKLRRNKDAVQAFGKALEVDSDSAHAHEGMAAAQSRLHQYEDAVDHALSAVGLLHDFPRAHLRLGVTLVRLDLFEQAIEAFETCLKLAPRTPAAHRWLAHIYESHVPRTDKAMGHRHLLKEVLREIKEGKKQDEDIEEMDAEDLATPDEGAALEKAVASAANLPEDASQIINVVTGLPRTGTSMMMQMLVAGGLEPLTDGNREADASNPKGYYEYEKATQLRSDTSWIGEGKGKVVKIVAQLLTELPAESGDAPAHYRVVFMDRDLKEVLASQHTMLDLQERKGADLDPSRLAKVFQDQLEKVHGFIDDRKIACLVVKHSRAIKDPQSVAADVNKFYGGTLDEAAMAAVVDPSLHREKTEKKQTT
jgi:predicted AlkP superfamily phosphohydrolase/phosphomutase/tetratricopeptide (TPR) repeat protein